jgi:hypothetical protein
MLQLFEDFPDTTLLSIVGFLAGTAFKSGFEFFNNYDFSGISSDPSSIFTNYFSDFLILSVKGALFGIVIGIIFGFIGLIIDFNREEEYEEE